MISNKTKLASALFLMRACLVNGFSWGVLEKVLQHEYECATLAKDLVHLEAVASLQAATKALRGLK